MQNWGRRIVAATLVALSVSSVAAMQPDDAQQPNIIIILADDLGYADIGVHGCTDIPTPNIDSIAARGVLCTQAYVSWPACNPSRAALMTGTYQDRFGFTFNPPDARRAPFGYGIPLHRETIAERLSDAGYTTGLVGKWGLGFKEHQLPTARGFDEFYGFLEGGFDYLPHQIERRWHRRKLLRGNAPEKVSEYLTDAFSRECVSFIDRHHEEPFFLYFAPNVPHVPMQADLARLERFAHLPEPRRTYAAMVSAFDDAVGAILSTLDKHDLTENTLVVFMNDNGTNPDNGGSNAPFRGVKGSLHEGAIRVPLLAMWPGKIPPGSVMTEPTIAMDVTATALRAAGVDVESETSFNGVDLMPWFNGEAEGVPHRVMCWRAYSVRGYLRLAIRQDDWKLTIDPPLTAPRLYNLAEDIGEQNDVAAENPDVVKALRRRWIQWDRNNLHYRIDLFWDANPSVDPRRGDDD